MSKRNAKSGNDSSRAAKKSKRISLQDLDFESEDEICSPKLSPDKEQLLMSDEATTTKSKRSDSNTGEVSELFKSFGANITQVMDVKRRKFEQLTTEVIRKISEHATNFHQKQVHDRKKLADECQKMMEAFFNKAEEELQKYQETKEKLDKMIIQNQKVSKQMEAMLAAKMQGAKKLEEQFYKSSQELDKKHQELFEKTQEDISKELSLFQQKLMGEVKEMQMMKVRQNLQKLFM